MNTKRKPLKTWTVHYSSEYCWGWCPYKARTRSGAIRAHKKRCPNDKIEKCHTGPVVITLHIKQ